MGTTPNTGAAAPGWDMRTGELTMLALQSIDPNTRTLSETAVYDALADATFVTLDRLTPEGDDG